MRRTVEIRWLIGVATAAWLMAPVVPAKAHIGSYDWSAATSLYGGVDRGFVQITGTAPLVINCLRIDTLAPGINFLTTPRATPWVSGSAETVRQTTSSFVSTSQTTSMKVVAAVNGDLFDIALSPTTTLEGFNVSNGTLVSPGAAPGGTEHATFSLTRSSAGSVVTTDDTTTVGDKWNAVTGIYQCLLSGSPRLNGTDPQPRTGLGVSSDTRYVYMMTVDGRSASSVGATNRQVGEWLLHFGASNGVYVDGGGSTTMAWWNPAASGANKAQVLNTPSDGSQRAVGNNIGVFFTTPSYVTGEYFWAGNGVRGGGGTWDTASANWRSGAIYGSAASFVSGSSAVGTTAVFTGVGGQVSPVAGTTTERIRFENSGFQLGTALAQSEVALVGDPEIQVGTGVSATIRSRLTAAKLVVRGSGVTVDNQLNLWPVSGSNALSGTVQLMDRVRVELAFASSAGTAAVQVQNGSAIDLRGYGVSYANPLTLAGAGVTGTGWALRFASGDIVAGGIRLTGSTAIRLGDTGAVAATISSAITGTGGLSYTGIAASSLSLTGRNTYSGTTTIDLGSGAVRIGIASEGGVGSVTAGAFGTGPVTLAGGRLTGFDATTPRTILNPLTVTGTVSLGDTYLSAPLTFAAPITLSGSRTVVVDSGVSFTGGVGQTGNGAVLVKTGAGTLTLAGSGSYTGGTRILAGRLVMATATALSTGSVSVAGGATLGVAPFVTADFGGLGLASTGLLDVTRGRVTVKSGLTEAGLVARLLEGRSGGTWSGTSGITSSSAAAALVAGQVRAVGWLDNGSGSFTVGYAAPGDTNLDGLVDVLDTSTFVSAALFDAPQPATWNEGDFNYDGIVDVLDVADFLTTGLFNTGFYDQQGGVQPVGMVAVPEPTGWWLAVMTIGVGGLLLRRQGGRRPPSPSPTAPVRQPRRRRLPAAGCRRRH